MKNLIPHFIHEQFVQQRYSGAFEAATLFVDMSGFTPLTETMLQHRQDGAEVLSEILEAIFGPLVREVYARGGQIPLFAGDAFTAIFPHNLPEALLATADAPLQALQSALFIQETLASQGRERRFPTKYGDFAIGVKVGLSMGTVHWGIPGRRGRYTFYFRGPAIDGCAQAEQQARRGEIVADEAIMPWIHPVVTAQQIGDGPYHRLIDCSLTPPPKGAKTPHLSPDDASPFVPETIFALPARAEFREICPIFISFAEPPEAERIHRFVIDAHALANDYGGTFSQVDFGDKGGLLVVFFGAPITYENNVERAAAFLLALRRHGAAIPWRAGMTFGLVWAGIRGGRERCEYSAIGDVVNLAARLALRANRGEIWTGEAACEHLGNVFRLAALGPLQLKGKGRAVPVYRLLARQTPEQTALHSYPMVGRQAELSQLQQFIQPILEGHFAGLATVHGDAGMGKSRLVYELQHILSKAHQVRWFTCPAEEILRQSLNPFKHFLRRYFDQSPEATPEENKARFDHKLDQLIQRVADHDPLPASDPQQVVSELERTRSFLGALVDLHWEGSLYEQLEPKLRFSNTLAAFKALIQAETLRQPVVLQLEDLHWLDTDSQALIQALTRQMAPYPLAIVCTSRYRDDGSRVTLPLDSNVPQRALDLRTLPPAGIQSLAGQLLAGSISADLATFLTEKTGGNPFFVEQLLLDLRERGVLDQKGDQWALQPDRAKQVPSRIGAVLVARLDRLATQVKEIVQTAAVLGREFEVQLLSRMLRGDPNLPERVQQATVERIWTALSEMRYIFRHTLMRDAAYDMQLRAQLRELHRLAGEAIEGVYAADLPPHYADLAHHYRQAGAPEQARHYSRLAGQHAAARYANIEAIEHFSRALDATLEGDFEGRYQLLLQREQIYDLQADRESQRRDLAALETMAQHTDDQLKLAQVALRQANYAHATSDYAAAVAAAQEAIELAGPGPVPPPAGNEAPVEATPLQAAGYVSWGRALWFQGEYKAAQPRLERALSLARSAELPQVEADCLRNIGIVYWYQGDYSQGKAYSASSLRICREIGDLQRATPVLNNLGIIHASQGDYAKAKTYFEESLQIRQKIGDRWGESSTLNNLGNISTHLGDLAEARTYFERALRIKEEIDDRRGIALTLGNLGRTASHLGDLPAARAYLEQSLAIFREINDRGSEGECLLGLGLIAHQMGEHERALHHCQRAMEIAQEIGDRRIEGYAWDHLGQVLAGLGRWDEATAAYQQALDRREELGQTHLAMETRANLAERYRAQQALSQAQQYVDEILNYLKEHSLEGAEDPLRVYLICYRVLRASQDPRAQVVLRQAHQHLHERAARIHDAGLRRSFLHQVSVHREIEQLWQQATGPSKETAPESASPPQGGPP